MSCVPFLIKGKFLKSDHYSRTYPSKSQISFGQLKKDKIINNNQIVWKNAKHVSFSFDASILRISYRDVIQRSFEVKATGGRFIVAVSFELHASISEDGCVVPPGGFGQVHIMWPRVESSLWHRKSWWAIAYQETSFLKTVFKCQVINTRRPHQEVGSNTQRSSSWDGLDGDALSGEENCCTDMDFF